VSKVHGVHEGDTFFPEFEERQWEERVVERYGGFEVVEYTRQRRSETG